MSGVRFPRETGKFGELVAVSLVSCGCRGFGGGKIQNIADLSNRMQNRVVKIADRKLSILCLFRLFERIVI